MPYPSEPDKIVFKNKFYPNGLKAKQIYNYYIANKYNIVKYANKRPVILFNTYELNGYVIRRNINGKPIILTMNNYEEIITGYNISISVETEYSNNKVREKIIDIDPKSEFVKFRDIKACLDRLDKKYIGSKTLITNSSSGFHFRIYLPRIKDREKALKELTNELNDFNREYGNLYLINDRRRTLSSTKINLDLVAMQSRGSITIPYALTREGVKCEPVNRAYNLRFKQNEWKSRILKGYE